MVFVSHCPLENSLCRRISEAGAFGVGVFFCLSAYLIVSLLLRERDRTGTIRLGAFAVRRTLRIWPLYFLVIAACCLCGLQWPAARIDGHMLLALSLMYANIWVAHVGWQHLGPISALWSISVEEQFYFFVPLVAKLGGRRTLWIVCGTAFAGAYLALAVIARQRPQPILQVWTNSFVQFQFFASGAAVAMLCYGRRLRIPASVRAILFAGGIGFVYQARRCGLHGVEPVSTMMLLSGYLFASLGVAAILISILDLPRSPPKATVYLGKISYGLYVFHYPLILFALTHSRLQIAPLVVQFPAYSGLLILTIGVAASSYHFIESPILKYKRRFETIKTRPV